MKTHLYLLVQKVQGVVVSLPAGLAATGPIMHTGATHWAAQQILLLGQLHTAQNVDHVVVYWAYSYVYHPLLNGIPWGMGVLCN